MFVKATLFSAVLIGAVSAKMEIFVPPIAMQTVSQASLPSVVNINYDVPRLGFEQALDKLHSRASFLGKRSSGQTDVYFEPPAAPAQLEAEYQSVLKSVEAQIENRFQALSKTVSAAMRASFIYPAREPTIKIFVSDAAKGKHVDLGRLESDAIAYAASRLAAFESGRASFVKASGDDLPRASPVVFVDIETPNVVSPTELSTLKGELATISQLRSSQEREFSELSARMAAKRAHQAK